MKLSRVGPGLAASLLVATFIATVQCGSANTGSYSNGTDAGSSGSSSSGAGSSTGSSSGGSSSGGSTGGSSTGSSSSSSGSSGTGSSGAGPDSGAEGGSSGGPATVADVFGTKNSNSEAVQDSFLLFPCVEQDSLNCKTDSMMCPSGSGAWVDGQGLMTMDNPPQQVGFQTHEYFQLGGTPGTMYLATIKVDAISEARGYVGGQRAAGNTVPTSTPPTGLDFFYTGGAPSKTNSDEDNYNIYEIIVWNPPSTGTFKAPSPTFPGAAAPASMLGSKVQNYFLNSWPDEMGTDSEATASHDNTYPVSYTHTIQVPGGGIIEYATEDQNCLAVDNCGLPGQANTSQPCGASGGLPIPNETGLTLPPSYMGTQVSSINVVGGASQPYHSQAFHIQVTDICVMGATGCTEM